MLRKICGFLTLVTLAVPLVLAADPPSAPAGLSAAQIVDKNVAARGGLQAWRAVQTLSLQGKMGAGGNQRAVLPVPTPHSKELANTLPRRPAEEMQLPFLMEMKRPRKVRVEVQFHGQTLLHFWRGQISAGRVDTRPA